MAAGGRASVDHEVSPEGTVTEASVRGSAGIGEVGVEGSSRITNEGHADGDHATTVSHRGGARVGEVSADASSSATTAQVGDDEHTTSRVSAEIDSPAGGVGVYDEATSVRDDDLSDGDIHSSDTHTTGGHVGGVDASVTTGSSSSFEGHGGIAGMVDEAAGPGAAAMAESVVGDLGAEYESSESQFGEARVGDHSVGQSSSSRRSLDRNPLDGDVHDSRTDTRSVHVDDLEASSTTESHTRTDFNPLDDGRVSHTEEGSTSARIGGVEAGQESHSGVEVGIGP
ncbi:MAG: hypothetical protein D6683_14215, partial [Actinomyces sp.]